MVESLLACPTDIIAAPLDIVWKILTDPAGWDRFYDLRVHHVDPPGPAASGQRLIGESGPRWLRLGIMFAFTRIDAIRHEMEFDGRLPLGITVHESLNCVALDAERCRVNYHCHFGFPSGCRGWLVRRVLGREFVRGPADSLQRLKRFAEKEHREATGDNGP